MKVRITHVLGDGIQTEEVEKIEPDTPIYFAGTDVQATNTANLFVPGANLYRDEEGLFYVRKENLLREEKI